eukprot:scaffold8832_cov139-Amphora_coffeaeformis.AAC.3
MGVQKRKSNLPSLATIVQVPYHTIPSSIKRARRDADDDRNGCSPRRNLTILSRDSASPFPAYCLVDDFVSSRVMFMGAAFDFLVHVKASGVMAVLRGSNRADDDAISRTTSVA